MDEAVSTTVPLLILISLGISSLLRDYDLRLLVDQKPWIGSISVFTKEYQMPDFGPFLLVHGLNHMIVFTAFSMSMIDINTWSIWSLLKLNNSGSFLLLFTVGIYSLFYPLLEVTEYQELSSPSESGFPSSLSTHFILTSLTLFASVMYEYLLGEFGPPATQSFIGDFPIPELQLLLGLLLLIGIPLTVILYSLTLAFEVRNQLID